MSRFSLRSHTDNTSCKEYEDEAETTSGKTTKTAAQNKRANQKKTKKKPKIATTTTIKTTTKITKTLVAADEIDEVDLTTINSSNTSNTLSLMCSLPLTRLSGIIEKLQLTKQAKKQAKFLLQQCHSTENGVDAAVEDEDVEQIIKATTIQTISNNCKLLCLYCDKKFNSTKLLEKHVEKFHMQARDRRSSGRNMEQYFPSCYYCKKPTDTTILENNLQSLFAHLNECHADKYFACKLCMLRFPSHTKLLKHRQMLHNSTSNQTHTHANNNNSLPYEDEDNDDTDSIATNTTTASSVSTFKSVINEQNQEITTKFIQQTQTHRCKRSLRLQTQQNLDSSNMLTRMEEPTILSRLGLAQHRLPSKRKGLRLRRETLFPEALLKSQTDSVTPSKLRSGRVSCNSTATTATITGRVSIASNSSSNSNSSNSVTLQLESPTREIFRIPTRNELLASYVIDDDFYKEVVHNVRINLLYYLDGKLKDNQCNSPNPLEFLARNLPAAEYDNELKHVVRSTLVRSPLIMGAEESELHAASLLNAVTAFPTLLTAEQYGGDALNKLRRPHTKHSWKWKWDSVKKYKLISEGGKLVKKIKPLLGLRDLSKLDMWTQLTMRRKHEQHQNQPQTDDASNKLRLERIRLNEELNYILDRRLLPQIMLEQNEQSVIKLEDNYEVDTPTVVSGTQYSQDELTVEEQSFLAGLHLIPRNKSAQSTQQRLVLSGEWARPRCYMCMCCGATFDKLKTLEEHKMFRHTHIYCTHYEVVGRELITNNLLQYLFLPKQALSRYNATEDNERLSNESTCNSLFTVTAEDESSDSLQSVSKQQHDSPTHSLQSCSSNNSYPHGLSPVTTPTTPTTLRTPCKIFNSNNNNNNNNSNNHEAVVRNCSKCQRKCSGAMDLYRHMLDCSGDYIWSMVKKRKYRYYCGSKKRRPCNKHLRGEMRKTPKQPHPSKTPDNIQQTPKLSPTPRQRPSDAESIKKMLENLPAKRVCKQIFPLDARKIKKKQSQSKHLLAKRSHLYKTNVLRQTRARQQMAQAAKILTKTKNKQKQRKQQQSRHQQKIMRNVRTKTLLVRKKERQQQNRKQSKNMSKLNATSSTTSPTTTNETKIKKNDSEESKSRSLTPKRNTAKEQIENNKKPVEILEKTEVEHLKILNTNVAVTTPTTTATVNVTTTVSSETFAMHLLPEYANSNASTTSTCTSNTHMSAASAATTNSTTRKRSKRISDCIAMLTGKLEEKLKTEQPTLTTTASATITPTTIELPIKDKQPQSVTVIEQQQITNTKEPPPKTLKRKAQSRRIIKPPSIENIVSHIEQKTSTVQPVATVKTTVAAQPVISLDAARLPNITVIPISTSSVFPKIASTLTVTTVAPSLTHKNKPTSTSSAPVPLPLPVAVLPTAIPNLTMTMPLPLPLPMYQVDVEPLNLTHSAKIVKEPAKTIDPHLRATAMPIPVYRSNLYGMDAHNLFRNEEMGPLDLSTKSKTKNHTDLLATSVSNMVPLALTVTANNNKTQMPTSLNEATKQFYSNLELLKIPQIRNMTTYTTTTTTAAVTISSDSNNVAATSYALSGHMLPGATKATMVVAPIVKKRGYRQQQNAFDNLTYATATTTMTTPMFNTISVTATSANACLSVSPTVKILQKEKFVGLGGRGKASLPLTMNEEVINHIDDAINSVINAVKASLTPEREEESEKMKETEFLTKTISLQQPQLCTISHTIPTTTITTTCTTAITAYSCVNTLPSITTSVVKNNFLNKMTTIGATITTNTATTQPPMISILPVKRRGRSKSVHQSMEIQPLTTAITPFLPMAGVTAFKTPLVAATMPKVVNNTTTITSTSQQESTTMTAIKSKAKVTCATVVLNEDEDVILLDNKKITPPTAETKLLEEKKLQETVEHKESITNATTITATTTNSVTKIETNDTTTNEQTEAKVVENVVSSNNLENVGEVQKKFRRRRKNELAAIVADQLLESFKIDKARRDNLMKLENLAYEKSDDLFMTGMLLMSSTKRSVTLNSAQKQQQSTANIENSKRSSLRNRNNTNANEKPATGKRARRESTGGRRPYRRRAKTLDNENISKLKSSLESFSIGIERQLSEFEAKKEREANSTEGRAKNTTNTQPAKTIILRPSILTATIEATPAPLTAENVAKVSINAAREQSKKCFASRDPRLNKNIHKGEIMDDNKLTTASTKPDVSLCDYEEEDNYLTEIAKNVNEKIMSAENEDFIFANDGLLGMEETNSQFYSRPPTSMSVRSAPNFDDRSDFGSMCGDDDDDDDEEHTNTEVTDMDLDDEMSVYTSYSQDIGRVGGRRRRRRRRSILLTRRPKKRINRDLNEAQKYECTLCKKIFFSATSLSKHNMTLAHVSKVSEQEYLLSKAGMLEQDLEEFPSLPKISRRAKTPTPASTTTTRGKKNISKTLEDINLTQDKKKTHAKEVEAKTTERLQETNNFATSSPHIALNPDERLFFECCTILKGTDTPRTTDTTINSEHLVPQLVNNEMKYLPASGTENTRANKKPNSKSVGAFRGPANYNKTEVNRLSPNYPGISQLSAVTNTSTFRIKTKAAMKGYENIDASLPQDLLEQNKSHTTCKLTELADIALGNEKTNMPVNHCAKTEAVTAMGPKTANESSTSSKTIMHSSILNAAVEVQNKAGNCNGASNKIVIPERPFKNIGLEEKEPITFQKPRTSSLSLLKRTEVNAVETVGILPEPENSASSASFSDRDDFDFGSLSCGDDDEHNQAVQKTEGDEDSSIRGVKTSMNSNEPATNIPLGISESSNNSNTSDVATKNFENKSLIMGRIFKNNTTKVPALKVKSVGVQKDPLPAKADLNQLFDELRGDVKPKTVLTSTGTNTSPTVASVKPTTTTTPNAQPAKLNENHIKESKIVAEKPKKTKNVSKEVAVVNGTDAVINVPKPKPKAKVGRKPKAKQINKKKDINKLQNELGLSPKEIEQLIDEGQRKSKRRCAANRNKKLVETWSSDEYEEFLSTKDVIALIEEKEKQEQEKRKRKTNTITNTAPEESRENLATSAAEIKHTTFAPISEPKISSQTETCTYATPSVITPTVQKTKDSKKNKRKTQQETDITNNKTDKNSNLQTLWNYAKDSKLATGKKRKHKHAAANELDSNILAAESYIMPTNYNEMIGTANRPLFVAEQQTFVPQPLMHSSHSAFVATTPAGFAPMQAEKKHKSHKKKKEHKEHKQHKKKIYMDNGDDLAVMHMLPETQPVKKHRGRKRKVEGKIKSKHSKRKRERKYYWSSSSSTVSSASESEESEDDVEPEEDKEHNNYSINGRATDVFAGSEHMQKHGWIVGDSHKKLVTLLAIAKGSKSSKKSDKKRKNSKRKNIK